MKACSRCGETKPASEFYRNATLKSGLQSDCKVCCCAKSRDWAARNPEKKRARDAAWKAANREHVLEYERRWIDANRERLREKWRKNPPKTTPEKKHARKVVSNALRDGRIERPGACEHCGGLGHNGSLHAHHSDYSRPLDVAWLCPICHAAEHKRVQELLEEVA